MIRNYIRAAHRNVVRNKLQSFIQILSLAIGLAVFTMVTFYIYDKLTVDRSNPFFEQVYRVESNRGGTGKDVVSFLLGDLILEQVPEITHMTRTHREPRVPISYIGQDGNLSGQTVIQSMCAVDTGFQQVFPQDYLVGDPEKSLVETNTIVLTESISKTLFHSVNPLGKTVYLWNSVPTIVTGVIRDPVNTHLRFEALISQEWKRFVMELRSGERAAEDLLAYATPTYVKLPENSDLTLAEKKIGRAWNDLLETMSTTDLRTGREVSLRPLREILYADYDPFRDYMSIVDRRTLMTLFFLGIGILLLGIINYINLNTARVSLRAREIALRKITGSSRGRLILYFLIESVINTFFAFLVAATLVQLFFREFNLLLQADINLYFLRSPVAWIATLLFVFSIGILAGIYPALQMSGQSPLDIFSGKISSRGGGLFSRRFLLVFQFSSAAALLISIFSMQNQIMYMQNQNLGFDTEQVIFMGTAGYNDEKKLDLLHRLKRIPDVEFACISQEVPGSLQSDDISPVDDPESLFYGLDVMPIRADLEYFEVYDLKFTHGGDIMQHSSQRNFTPDTSTESSVDYIIINETCREALKLDDPVGVPVGNGGIISGVVEDFHFQSLIFPIKPLAIYVTTTGYGWFLSMKINSRDMTKTMEEVRKTFAEMWPEQKNSQLPGSLSTQPPRYTYVEDFFDKQYLEVERIQTASSYLSIMAVIIACLGLFGLSTFMAQTRTKEIGIRRAFGASENLVFMLLARDFLKWVSFSILIGLPLGWYMMKHWQRQFAYKAPTGIWIYVLTIFIVLVISLATIAWQSLKASRANPVDSLRAE